MDKYNCCTLYVYRTFKDVLLRQALEIRFNPWPDKEDYKEELYKLSKSSPHLWFCLCGFGEKWDSIICELFHNGKDETELLEKAFEEI